MPKLLNKPNRVKAGAPDRFKIHVPVVKAYEDERGDWWIEGTASGPKKDLQEERMSRACIDSMQQQINSTQLPLRVSHWADWDGDIGFLREASVDPVSYEMRVKVWLDRSDPHAQKLWRRLQGDPRKGIQPQRLGLSIGGRLVSGHSELQNEKYVYVLDEIALDHVAVTSSPAYPDAWIDGTRGKSAEPRLWIKAIRKAWTPARWRDQLVTADPEEDDDMSKRRRRQRAKDNLDPAAVGGTAKQDPEELEEEKDEDPAEDDPEKSDDDTDAEDPEKSDDDDDPEKSEDDDEDAAPAKGGPSVETLVTVITDGVMEAVKAATPDLIRKAMSQQPGFWKRSGDLEGEEEVWCRDQEAEQDLEAEEEDDPDAFEDDGESDADEDEEKNMPTIDQLRKAVLAERRKNRELEDRISKLEGKKVPSREERAKGGERRGKGPDRKDREDETNRRAKGEEKKSDPRKWVEEIKASDAYLKATPQQRVDLLKRGMIRTLSQSESSAA